MRRIALVCLIGLASAGCGSPRSWDLETETFVFGDEVWEMQRDEDYVRAVWVNAPVFSGSITEVRARVRRAVNAYTGCMVIEVGPSGAGHDAILSCPPNG